MSKKEKKEKTVYIDDGRTIADMSGVSGGLPEWTKYGTTSSVKDILRTYFGAMRMMLLPTLAIVGLLLVAFLIVALIFIAM